MLRRRTDHTSGVRDKAGIANVPGQKKHGARPRQKPEEQLRGDASYEIDRAESMQ